LVLYKQLFLFVTDMMDNFKEVLELMEGCGTNRGCPRGKVSHPGAKQFPMPIKGIPPAQLLKRGKIHAEGEPNEHFHASV
jgi:hypothetical protein